MLVSVTADLRDWLRGILRDRGGGRPECWKQPEIGDVSLTVLDPGQSPEPEAAPSGLILVGQVGSATAAAQTITLLNHSDAILTYTSTAVTEDGQRG